MSDGAVHDRHHERCHGVFHGGCSWNRLRTQPWRRLSMTPRTPAMDDAMTSSTYDTIGSSMDDAMALSMVGVRGDVHGRPHVPPTHTRHSVALAMGTHGIFHGRAPWEQPWSHLWCTMDGAMIQSNTMACTMAHNTGPWTVPWYSPWTNRRRWDGSWHRQRTTMGSSADDAIASCVHGIVHGRRHGIVHRRCHGRFN